MTGDEFDAVFMPRHARPWSEMLDACRSLGQMIIWRREEPVRFYIQRLEALFAGAPHSAERQRQPLLDFETREIQAELRRRVREDRDPLAARILGVSVPAQPRRQREGEHVVD